jgi:hypothetical protein
MIINEKSIIHFVDVITGEDQNVLGLVAVNKVEVLPDRVGCAPVPVKAHPLLGRNGFEKMAHFPAENIPSLFQMIVERLGFVLRQNDDFVNLRVNAVAEGEIDQTVNTAKWDCRLGAILSERHQSLTPTPGHDKGKGISHHPHPLLPEITTKRILSPT